MNQTQLVFLESVSSDPRMHFCLAERYHCSKLQQLMKGSNNFFSTKIAKLFQEKPTHDNTDRDTTHQSHMCSWKSDMTINTEADFESLHLVWCLMFDQQPPCGSASMRFSALAHEAALVVQFNPTVPGLMEVQKHHPRVPVLDPKIPPKKNSAWPCFQIWKRKNMEKRWCWIEFPLDQSTEFCVTSCNVNRDGDLPWRILLLISY